MLRSGSGSDPIQEQRRKTALGLLSLLGLARIGGTGTKEEIVDHFQFQMKVSEGFLQYGSLDQIVGEGLVLLSRNGFASIVPGESPTTYQITDAGGDLLDDAIDQGVF